MALWKELNFEWAIQMIYFWKYNFFHFIQLFTSVVCIHHISVLIVIQKLNKKIDVRNNRGKSKDEFLYQKQMHSKLNVSATQNFKASLNIFY